MRKIFLSLFLVLIPFVQFIVAQEVVTMLQCQEWAVAQSSANVQKELNAELLKVKLNDVSSHLYPKLEINGRISYQSDVPQLPDSFYEDYNLDKLSRDYYGVTLDFEQVVFDGLKSVYARKYEKMMNMTEINKLDLTINDLKEQVLAIYMNLLILDKQLVLLQNVEKTISEQLEQLKTLYKEGVVHGNTVSELELQALKIEQQSSELISTKKTLVASLSIITGRDLSNVIFEVPSDPIIDHNSESLRLEFNIFETSKKGLDFQRKMYVFNSLPSISIYATGGYGRPSYNIFQNQFKWFYQVGVNFKVTLISWAKTVGIGDIVMLQRQILQSQEFDFRTLNAMKIKEKSNEIMKLENLLSLDEKITQKYAEITATYKIQLMNGTITAYDYIKQQNDELQSLINKEMHNMQLLKAKFEMLALQGRL